mmetsp:Transcript_27645/g.55335  ORF Transcript_27645/g.55335 Transcript_27645/m.55335 type:complete len:221 (+) Transcript_27645:718-1380(+)
MVCPGEVNEYTPPPERPRPCKHGVCLRVRVLDMFLNFNELVPQRPRFFFRIGDLQRGPDRLRLLRPLAGGDECVVHDFVLHDRVAPTTEGVLRRNPRRTVPPTCEEYVVQVSCGVHADGRLSVGDHGKVSSGARRGRLRVGSVLPRRREVNLPRRPADCEASFPVHAERTLGPSVEEIVHGFVVDFRDGSTQPQRSTPDRILRTVGLRNFGEQVFPRCPA